MAQSAIGGLALLAILTSGQTRQSLPHSQIRPYTVETVRAGAGAPKEARRQVTVLPDVRPPVFERQNRVERGPCNMPIIVANPDIDPRMVVPVERRNADAKIRVIEPRACGGLPQPAAAKR
jgi:hypothetical protein